MTADRISQDFGVYKMMNTVSILLNIVRLFLNLGFHERMGLVTATISRVWSDLWHFMILFVTSALMFAFMG